MQDVSAWLTQTAWNDGRVRAPAVLKASDGYVFAEIADDRARDLLSTLETEAGTLARTELVARLVAGGVNAYPVLSLKESSQLPQVLERKIWFYLHSSGFEWPMLASPLRLQKTAPFVSHIAPEPDSDRTQILREHGIELAGQG
jgi:crotonobetainyl-CoA:carnitine CoA-transferase CaiB-like acyl-CoA transferase